MSSSTIRNCQTDYDVWPSDITLQGLEILQMISSHWDRPIPTLFSPIYLRFKNYFYTHFTVCFILIFDRSIQLNSTSLSQLQEQAQYGQKYSKFELARVPEQYNQEEINPPWSRHQVKIFWNKAHFIQIHLKVIGCKIVLLFPKFNTTITPCFKYLKNRNGSHFYIALTPTL